MPDVITYNAAIQACATAWQSITALHIFDEARQNVEINIITYNAILDAVCASDPVKARELYLHGRNLYGNVHSIENSNPKLDLHNHSEGAGETAVRWWLEQQAPAMTCESEQLIIVTGWGKSRSAIKNGDLRGSVERLLTDLCVPMLPDSNRGRLVVDAQAWRSLQPRSHDHSLTLLRSSLQD